MAMVQIGRANSSCRTLLGLLPSEVRQHALRGRPPVRRYRDCCLNIFQHHNFNNFFATLLPKSLDTKQTPSACYKSTIARLSYLNVPLKSNITGPISARTTPSPPKPLPNTHQPKPPQPCQKSVHSIAAARFFRASAGRSCESPLSPLPKRGKRSRCRVIGSR